MITLGKYGGEILVKILWSRNFFDAVNWTHLNAETTKSAAPVVDGIICSISNHRKFWANQAATITRNAGGRNF
jgi:hypothetical protein